MKSPFRFLRDQSGLTTIEWVVLCAVVLLAAFGISNMVLQGADKLGGSVATKMSTAADQVN
jgi:Flp pilus assembly pilin Flp